MYQLTCPHCRHAAELPFVRIGASAVCEKCGQRFLIAEEQVRRPAPPPPQPQPVVPRAPQSGEADERRGLDDSGQMVGLSGLSEVMKRRGGSAPQAQAAAVPGATKPTPWPGPIPRRRAGVLRSGWRLTLWLAGVLGVLVFTGVLVWFNTQQQSEPAPARAAEPSPPLQSNP